MWRHPAGWCGAGALLVALVLGCGEQDTRSAEQGLAAMAAARAQAQLVGARFTAERMLQAFQIRHGRYPRELAELEASEGALPALPPGYAYSYEPASGKLEVEHR
ncbi:MAG: hypothetical protein KatS3mg102_1517 [Planctomycetota bacterium]|nr:MAG: hypothetical protein KatS3mg102_1517 [Planctomycetota bacterium]